MRFLDILKKLRVLRLGSSVGTSTDAANRPAELQIEKTKLVLSWILGIFFIAVGIFSFSSSFVAGFFGVLIGLAIFPKTANFLVSRVNFLANKKWRVGLIVASFLIFLFTFGDSTKEYSINIGSGQDDPQIVMDFQKDLIALINNYKEAQIRTVVISQIKFGGAKLEEAQKYTKETEEIWDEVKKLAGKMERYIEYQEKREIKPPDGLTS